MSNFLTYFFSEQKKIERLETKLKTAILSGKKDEVNTLFSKAIVFIYKKGNLQLLSDFLLKYITNIEEKETLNNYILPELLREMIIDLEKSGHNEAVLKLYEHLNISNGVLSQLSKLGKANEIAVFLTKENNINPNNLSKALEYWEKHNGDIRNNPTMVNVFKNISSYSPESIPDIARVKEAIGIYKRAAELYQEEGDLQNTAICFEKAGNHEEALVIYERIGNQEGVSRTAELIGDHAKALAFVNSPERKITLLVKLGRFEEARDIAVGLNESDKYFRFIKNKAKEMLEYKKNSFDYVSAMDLSLFAETTQAEKDEILLLGRKYYENKIVSASSEEEIKSVYKVILELEEKAGHFAEAGRIAEEILDDLEWASFLYEKANLFNRAIDTASDYYQTATETINPQKRLAELHEKGGNLLKAAKLYEELGNYEKAYLLFEKLQNFSRAIDCYLNTEHPFNSVLVDLYKKAGEYEKATETYIESGALHDLENALIIAKDHKLYSHIKVIEGKISKHLSGCEEDLKSCFEQALKEVLAEYTHVFGIDFGTTNSVAAIFNKKKEKVEIVSLNERGQYEPSYFGIDDNNHPVFGDDARKKTLTSPDRVVSSVKRSLGKSKTFSLGKEKYKCEEIVASILQRLKLNTESYLWSKVEQKLEHLLKGNNLVFSRRDLTAFLNRQYKKNSIVLKDVVLSVPAYFNDKQKKSTKVSAEIAGLNVKRLLHEPTSAAIAFGYKNKYDGIMAVIDLGGGTFDISILEALDGLYDIRTVDGEHELGGNDIDELLADYFIKDIKSEYGFDLKLDKYRFERARLKIACEELKINLSEKLIDSRVLIDFLNMREYVLTMNRSDLEKISRPVLAKMKKVIEKTIKPYRQNLDNYILVGNATKMPAVKDLVADIIKSKELHGFDPGTVVATGVALQGANLSGDIDELLLLDVVPFSLGISVIDRNSENKLEKVSKLIRKDSTTPVSCKDTFTTTEDNQTEVRIKVYQGESEKPEKNHFLGSFLLSGILPAPAGKPQIDVLFKISTDCILQVTAIDRATNKKQSINLEGTIMLSPQETENLIKKFADNENIYSLKKELEEVKTELEILETKALESIESADMLLKRFFNLFHDKVEVNAKLYKATQEQTKEIQKMIIEKDLYFNGTLKYKDQFASITNSIKQYELKQLDFTDKNIISMLKERVSDLSTQQKTFEGLIKKLNNNITIPISNWINVIEAMEPDTERMNHFDIANYHLASGRAEKAIELLEEIKNSSEGLNKKTFNLLLKCYVRMGLREDYRDLYKKFGNLFEMNYPDFNRLNSYMKTVVSSIFMIRGINEKQEILSGTGFSVTENQILTNRHVVEDIQQTSIKVIGKNITMDVVDVVLDQVNDIALLKVKEVIEPLRLGEFDFVDVGEEILAIGFPSSGSEMQFDDIFISKGIVNSIRKISNLSERVIFIDSKIGGGMSGGPLINDLGEVVGIITLSIYDIRNHEFGPLALDSQPVALPIHLVKKYL